MVGGRTLYRDGSFTTFDFDKLVADVHAAMARIDETSPARRELVQKLECSALASDVVLNVNVPDRPYDDLVGIEQGRLGFRHKAEPVVKSEDPHGRTIFWVGPAGPGQDSGEGTDFHALDRGAVAVTPLKIDLTRHEALPQLADWLRDD